MSDIDTLALKSLRNGNRGRDVEIEKRENGYVIRSGNKAPVSVLFGQVFAFFLGVVFTTAGLGLLLLPSMFLSTDFGPLRIGAAGLFGAGAAYLLWFASRGSQTEVHFDTEQRTIAEVIQNRAGKPTVLATYPFDEIGGVYLETAGAAAPAQLVLGYRGKMVLVAEGREAELDMLRETLARDLVGPIDLGAPRRRVSQPVAEAPQKGKAA